MKNAFLVGESIYLRPLEKEDAPQIAEWLNDREITRPLLVHRPINRAGEERYLEQVAQSENDVNLGIARHDDALIGVTGLGAIDMKNRHASFGIFIGDKTQWGKGYGSEATRLMVGYAFDTLNLNKVWLHVIEHNERAIRAYERVGFKREGSLREYTFVEGRYWANVVMSILREDWLRSRAG
ncbi:MAG: GNAT family N-acetyltransferase [Myxococcales bacterium]|jgi:ribosomal-protein-alanine N-acetyltransferase